MKGLGVSSGIAIGRAFVIQKGGYTISGDPTTNGAGADAEIVKFDQAVGSSLNEVKFMISNKDLYLKGEDIEILKNQIEFLINPQIRVDVLDKIQNGNNTAHDSLILVTHRLVRMDGNSEAGPMFARSADIQDIVNRLLKHLNSSVNTAFTTLERDTIVIAEDITSSDTKTMDLSHVIGFATRAGGKTSHTAILAKSKGIPAVVACGERLDLIKNNDIIILDGKNGHVLINPDNQSLNEYVRLQKDHARMTEALKSLMDISAVTEEGTEIALMGNISDAEELDDVFESGGQGVGLFRTEMIFRGRDSLPTEDEQFEFYKKVADNSNQTSVTVRTIDIGGDKQIQYFNLPREHKPFLDYRAIRISLAQPDLFRVQLKAILRASAFGNFKIMFPMISNLGELRNAKEILEQSKEELRVSKIAFDETIATGILIEIPSAAITADILAKEVDFFSIGTNDLCQYTLAFDRRNEKIQHLYDPFNPAVLRLIKFTIEQAHLNKIHVGICGELASDPIAVRLLLGMGLRELSMNANSIFEVKKVILSTSMVKAKALCDKVMEMEDSVKILEALQEENSDIC